MKTLILLLTTTICISQTNFTLDNNQIKWEKIYEGDFSKLSDYLSNQSFTRTIENLEGETNYVKIKTYNEIKAFARIDVKDDRYRVTLTEIAFMPMDIGMSVGSFSATETAPVKIDRIAIKKGAIKTKGSIGKMMQEFDTYFTEAFTIKENTKDDW